MPIRSAVASSPIPITYDDVVGARERIASYISPTPLRDYSSLNELVGRDIRVLVKHENLNPTNAFKVRNALAAVTGCLAEARVRGVIAGTTGNHGLGLAYAGRALGVPTTLCVPHGNNPSKNAAIRALDARIVETGSGYDDAAAAADEIAQREGQLLVHSTNNRFVLAGAGTITLEILEQNPNVDAVITAVGGGSQAVGAITVARAVKPSLRIYGVQAAGASAILDSWRARKWITYPATDTFAEGIATRTPYELTFAALCDGLTDFVSVSDAEMAEAIRIHLRTTRQLAEPAGAASLAGLFKVRDELAGKTVAIVLSGGNIAERTLADVQAGAI